MSKTSPRARLEERVSTQLHQFGYDSEQARTHAAAAVDAFYAHDTSHPFAQVVADEAMALITEVVPPMAVHIRRAFEGVSSAIHTAANAMSQLQFEPPVERTRPVYDASGLPVNDGPGVSILRPPPPPGDSLWPCVECGQPAGQGNSHCTGCLGISSAAARPLPSARLEVSADGGRSWQNVPGVTSVEVFGPDDDLHASAREYPTDRITGAPYHYIVNGDHGACGCGGHLVECQTHDDPMWRHAPSICGITRTLCQHTPRHTYRERCSHYATDFPPISLLNPGRPDGTP
jgi:hypothetical protein